jgi:transcriptional regulator with XRE-family HTH domain
MTNPFKGWNFRTPQEEQEMKEDITEKNCGKKLKLIRDISGITQRDLAAILGVSESTIKRLESESTKPTKDFMLMLAALCIIGKEKYSKMSEADKEKISEIITSAGGAAVGVGASIAAISASGAVAGLSAAGITSGLAAIGGGAMLGGIAVVACVPIAAGAAGYGLVKAIKKLCEANRLDCKEVDDRYEITPKL